MSRDSALDLTSVERHILVRGLGCVPGALLRSDVADGAAVESGAAAKRLFH